MGMVVADWTAAGLSRLRWYLGPSVELAGAGQLQWRHRHRLSDAAAVRRVWQRWREPLELWGEQFWRAEPPVMLDPLWEPAGPLDLTDLSPFSLRVLRQLALVRFGERLSYGELAEKVGVAGGARGVAQALARNRWPVLLPCHRVVAANGTLGGYSGAGGVPAKRWLLDHERGHDDQSGLFGGGGVREHLAAAEKTDL